MIYLFDANTLIQAKNEYYPLDDIPQFWDWLVNMGENESIKVTEDIFDEITSYSDELCDWIKEDHVRSALLLSEPVDPVHVNYVMEHGYQSNDPLFTETDIEKIGRDAFLVASARADDQRVIVTKEVSKPSKVRGNRHLPDVCNEVGVKWTRDFEVYRALGFSLAGYTRS